MVKKSLCATLILSTMLLFSGCSSLTGSAEPTETEVVNAVPNGAVVAETGSKIELTDITLTLPDGLRYGKQETEDGTSYYVWKTDDEYNLPSSVDIVFYIYEGNDKKTPDANLEEAEARSSISNYMQSFVGETDEVRTVLDAGMTSNKDWYTLCFTGYGGSTNEVTSYGTYCYPKSYYGVYMLQKAVADDYSRNYYGFIFSNDGTGDILTESEYNSLFSQIKNGFAVETFFTMPQMTYDAATDYSNGYSYEQLKTLFNDTTNYYIITGGRAAETETEEATETTEETESAEAVSLSPLYDVVRVVDGDTIVVSIEDKEVKVRLIGVDTPESVHEDENKNTAEGKEASEWTTDLLTGAKVYLEYDVETEDKYGRTLAYVYLDDGKTMVNRLLLENGLAQVMTVQPNSKYADEFYNLQVAAREAGKGFWGTGFFEQTEKAQN